MPKVSVIIPVYGVEEYLPECLASISRQTFRDFELILVDDGSPDGCGALCDAYAAEHPNTRVIHQENAGQSVARNRGVAESSGEYITFIDSDDYVTPDYIEYLLYLAEKFDAEISVAGMVKFWDGRKGKIPNSAETEREYKTGEALSLICYGKIGIFLWGKLFKRHLVEANPCPAGKIYEDVATTHKIVGATNAVASGSRVIYYWRQRAGSTSHAARVDERQMYGLTAAKEQLAYMQKNYPEAIAGAQVRCAKKIMSLASLIVMSEKQPERFEYLRAEMKPLLRPLWKNRRVKFRIKVLALCLRLGYGPYSLVLKAYSRISGNGARQRFPEA